MNVLGLRQDPFRLLNIPMSLSAVSRVKIRVIARAYKVPMRASIVAEP